MVNKGLARGMLPTIFGVVVGCDCDENRGCLVGSAFFTTERPIEFTKDRWALHGIVPGKKDQAIDTTIDMFDVAAFADFESTSAVSSFSTANTRLLQITMDLISEFFVGFVIGKETGVVSNGFDECFTKVLDFFVPESASTEKMEWSTVSD